MNSGQPNSFQPDDAEYQHEEPRSRDEILDSLLDRTKGSIEDGSYHAMLTDYVREHRLSSKFDFENLCELVRCVLGRTDIEKLPIDKEDAINWIATSFQEDPVANERVESLWNSIVSRMHDHD